MASSRWLPALLAALVAWPCLLGAATLQVAPTTITVPASRTADGLTLRNSGTVAIRAQVRAFTWTQKDGEDVLEPARDITISPPMLSLGPGEEQLVRVVRIGPPPASGPEPSFRLIVDELPVDAATPAPTPQGLRFVLRYSIPVFLGRADGSPTAPVLDTRLVKGVAGREVEIGNDGDGHAQVADLVHVDTQGRRTVISPGLSGYVLPGQRRRWPLPSEAVAGGAILARINGETTERTLVPDPAPR